MIRFPYDEEIFLLRNGQNQNRSDAVATNASTTPKVGSAATSAAANSTAASSAAVNSATAATAPRIDEEKIKMALHLIQQMDPGKTVDQEEEKKLRELEVRHVIILRLAC